MFSDQDTDFSSTRSLNIFDDVEARLGRARSVRKKYHTWIKTVFIGAKTVQSHHRQGLRDEQ